MLTWNKFSRHNGRTLSAELQLAARSCIELWRASLWGSVKHSVTPNARCFYADDLVVSTVDTGKMSEQRRLILDAWSCTGFRLSELTYSAVNKT